MNENLAKGKYREFYERQLAFIAAKDVEGLIRTNYTDGRGAPQLRLRHQGHGRAHRVLQGLHRRASATSSSSRPTSTPRAATRSSSRPPSRPPAASPRSSTSSSCATARSGASSRACAASRPTRRPARRRWSPADLELRNRTYHRFVELGRAPTAEEVAASAGVGVEEVEAGWRRLHDAHALVLDPVTSEIVMANPFAARPTPFRVEADGRWWDANCAWDAFGIGAALGVDSRDRDAPARTAANRSR